MIFKRKNNFFVRLSIQERINFSRHLAVMIKAGLPLIEGLKIIRRQDTSKNLNKIVDQLLKDVNNGQSLAASLQRFRGIFGDFYVSIIHVGESSGSLADNLFYLAEEIKKSKDLRNKVRAAMVYPAILFVMTVAVSSFLTFVVFPKILPTFANFDVELPATTRILIASLEFLKNYWWAVSGGFIGFIFIMRVLMKIESIKYGVHRFLLFLPVLSKLSVDINMANFTRIFAILLKSGVKIVEAMVIVSNTFENRVYRASLLRAAEEVKKGESFAEQLVPQRKFFPPLLTAMIEVGENTGNLEENLVYLSQYYSEEVDGSLKNLTTVLEPLILLAMGLLVGFVALSIITPIYTISQGLQQ